jgi:ribosome production factor 1
VQKAQKKAQEKRQREVTKAEELGIVPERKVPKTLDNTREQDVTTVQEGDEDIEVENEQDEFAEHFQNLRPPHVLLTTSFKATSVMYKFCSDLMVRTPSTSLP